MQKWIDDDLKSPPLKALQGLIWEKGYRSGELRGMVYDDALQAMRGWHAQGLRLAIYSSGSALAQRLLFGASPAGDITSTIAAFFDTAIGMKRETLSYKRIAQELALAPPDILFLSDVPEELDAARAAGMATVQVVRASDGTVASGRHPVVTSLIDIGVEAIPVASSTTT
jgi:enolase-phosphatase E1